MEDTVKEKIEKIQELLTPELITELSDEQLEELEKALDKLENA